MAWLGAAQETGQDEGQSCLAFQRRMKKKKSPPVAEAPENSKNKSTGPPAPKDQPLTSLPPCGMSFLWLL